MQAQPFRAIHRLYPKGIKIFQFPNPLLILKGLESVGIEATN
jgi:hypothetical protein